MGWPYDDTEENIMSLQFYPGAWRIMQCDFNTGFKPPEMIKIRPVITISRARNDGARLCTVIPISSAPPNVVRDFHYQLPTNLLPIHIQANYPESWVKVDMIQTVSFSRLVMYWHGRKNGDRVYQTGAIPLEHRQVLSQKLSNRIALAP